MAGTSRRHPPTPVIVIALLVVLGGGLWWWTSHSGTAGSQGLTASGEMEAREYQVASALAGRVTKVRVAEGDVVTKGQELVRLDRSALTLQREQAEQGVVAAKAAVTSAEDDGTDAEVVAARARLAQARAAVKLAEVQLGYASVTAPRDGVVVSVLTNAGQNAAPGKTLVTMIDPNDLFVRVFVPETEIGDVTVGQAATITTDSSSDLRRARHLHRLPGRVHAQQRRDQGAARQARLRGAGQVPDDSGSLKAGMPVDVTFASS